MDIEEHDSTHNLDYEYAYSLGKFSFNGKASDTVRFVAFWTTSHHCWYRKNNS